MRNFAITKKFSAQPICAFIGLNVGFKIPCPYMQINRKENVFCQPF